MNMRPQTKVKYTACIKECYAAKKFLQEDMRNKYLLDNNLFVAMHQCNVIKTINGICTWTDVVLTEQIVNNILSVYSNHRKTKNSKRFEKRKFEKLKQQLTINSIKNPQHQARAQAIIDESKRIVAQRTQPVPMREELVHDTSNSKMFLLMAVGTAIGFLIATIIWK